MDKGLTGEFYTFFGGGKGQIGGMGGFLVVLMEGNGLL